jgi:ABC-type phosphate transport system substrate-binding protein
MTDKQEAEWLCAKAMEIAVHFKGPSKKKLNSENYREIYSEYEEIAGWIIARITENAKEMIEMKMIKEGIQ